MDSICAGLVAVVAVCGTAWGEPLRADVTRTSAYTLHLGEGFEGSGGRSEISWSFSGTGNPDGYFIDAPNAPLSISLRRTQQNATAIGWGDVEVDSFDIANTSPPLMTVHWGLADPQVPGTLSGGLGVGYDFEAVNGLPGGGSRFDSFLFRYDLDGERLLRFFGGGENLVSVGDRFVVDVTMNGRWDPAGQGAGSVRFLGLHESFAIQEFFTYDASSDTTRFLAAADSYVADPELKFDLVGVPSPGGAAGFVIAACFTVARRRRARPDHSSVRS